MSDGNKAFELAMREIDMLKADLAEAREMEGVIQNRADQLAAELDDLRESEAMHKRRLNEKAADSQRWAARAGENAAELGKALRLLREARRWFDGTAPAHDVHRLCLDIDNLTRAHDSAATGDTPSNPGAGRQTSSVAPAVPATGQPKIPVHCAGHDAADHDRCEPATCEFRALIDSVFPTPRRGGER